MAEDSNLIKETGATFTPSKLADFISDRILSYLHSSNHNLKILDPACGEGALLSSISKKFQIQNIDFELIGYDSNQEFLDAAQEKLNQFINSEKVCLHHSDFLQEVQPERQQISLSFNRTNDERYLNNSIDVVIANPPYVRTQILGAEYAQMLARKFQLKGRVDLYYPFLLGMTYALKNNGLLGVITSNRYLSTKSGISVRKFLENSYEILEIIDLGDTKLFDAAVLPAIFIGRKKASKQENIRSKFIKIYEELNGYNGSLHAAEDIYEALSSSTDGFFNVENKKYKKTSGVINFVKSKDATWALLSNEESKWVEKIKSSSSKVIGDFFKVRVGIKTTADKVFIRDDWENITNRPEEDQLKDLISQENIMPWRISKDTKLRVLYPHFSVDGKKCTIDLDEYPKAKAYLEEYKERLSSRKYLIEAGRKWYEIWVPQKPSLWSKPKLVFPDISLTPRFLFDDSGKIVNGNCYWIVAEKPKDLDFLLLIQGISNSMLMTKYHDLMFNNKLYSGRRRYFSQYVEKYPVPDINSRYSREIISLVKKLNTFSGDDNSDLVRTLEVVVAKAFDVEPVSSLS